MGKHEKESAEARESQLNDASKNVKKETINPLSICYSKKIKIKNLTTCERHLHDAFAFCRISADIIQDKFEFNSPNETPTEFFDIEWEVVRAVLDMKIEKTTADKNDSGFIYLATSDDCPGDVKIGITQNESVDIKNFSIRYCQKVTNPEICKKIITEAFVDSYRTNAQEEIFKINWRAIRSALLFMKTVNHLATVPDPPKEKWVTCLTPLMIQARKCNIKGVEKELLNASETDINAQRDGGRTALMWAINPYYEKNHYLKIFEKIMDKNPNIEITTNNGKTALMIAAKHGKDYAVKMLLDAGAKKM
ncbi:MAG: ankyrin repeat domain-containing protein [Gammaproteobacteria bacterium WSBS_2016_MAG_OTU1]